MTHQKLTVLAVGKLTNVALAVKKEPSIIPNIRLVWLGSNYPEPGEYNQENDIESLNFLLSTDITFEMVTVRYGKLSGTDFVKVTEDDVQKRIAPLGETIATPVTGRHGGEYFSFGAYAISLFDNTSYFGDPPSRSLFDMAAVAIVKNPSWAKAKEIPSPILIDKKWVEIPENNRKIVLWEYFNQKSILNDFYEQSQDLRKVDGISYTSLFETVLSDFVIREKYQEKPKLAIFGPLEGRLSEFDRIITVSYTHLTLPTNREV